MAWASPLYSRTKVDGAGATWLRRGRSIETDEEYETTLAIINNWRASHSYPLNKFQEQLRRRTKKADSTYLVAQRLKRLSSIRAKLERFPTMRLSMMQDIGGCRAIVASVPQVKQMLAAYKASHAKHLFCQEDDYLTNPKPSGYRGIHLIYKYFSEKSETYNNLKLEIQLRTRLQHAWATAVETVGTFISQALKSSQGEERWLRFFALMGSAIGIREKCNPVPGTPLQSSALQSELRSLVYELGEKVICSHLAPLYRLSKMPRPLRTTFSWSLSQRRAN